MATAAAPPSQPKASDVVNVDDDDEHDDASIDEDQLDEYRDMVDALGTFPDKVKINSLSMVAEDHNESKAASTAIYNIIRERLLNGKSDNLLPLIYVVDSILKNAKGQYIQVVEEDAASWFPVVYRKLSEPQKAKLKKVWNTWNDARLFEPESLKIMGRCFDDNVPGKSLSSTTTDQVAGISRTKDGTLLLPKSLRVEMQNILDDLQNDIDEAEKVSLERLAVINPDLLANIKETAKSSLSDAVVSSAIASTNAEMNKDDGMRLPDFCVEVRSSQTLAQIKEWKDVSLRALDEAHAALQPLQEQVLAQSLEELRFSQQEVFDMTNYLAAASATASVLAMALEGNQNLQQSNVLSTGISLPGKAGAVMSSVASSRVIDPSLFTNDGIKKKNPAVIGLLYEIGLPFVSSADGRRFRTQFELSNHLDVLFKRGQLEKSMARTEERGWSVSETAWMGRAEDDNAAGLTDGAADNTDRDIAEDGYSPETSTVPADESRERCVICGINFKMFFDNGDGMYRYSNCREIDVLNDEVAINESEAMLVHVSCWRGLGSPEVLTMDQALQETLHHLL